MRRLFPLLIVALVLGVATSCNSNKNTSAIDSIADMNKQDGEKYVAEQMKKDTAFIKTESGLCYKILEEGEGENFKPTETVDVIYVGKHIDGTEFDSSKGETVPFALQNVVPGFREVITLMKPGAKAIAIIPSHLGYGDKGQGPIGPNETLVFELTTVELHK
ncbi:MAG: FKBP-type peptidyl-prolyl cis-trans isomerase [Muribaculaceae bacterium]|nr:FKBP-type peptidyl-prolyl cis-trans isomerase [Muribaculaceae bacterium]